MSEMVVQLHWGGGEPRPEPVTMLDRLVRAVEDIAWREGEREPRNAHDDAREIVLAVLGTLREPTETIGGAGWTALCEPQGVLRESQWHAHQIFTAMIDAALAEDAK